MFSETSYFTVVRPIKVKSTGARSSMARKMLLELVPIILAIMLNAEEDDWGDSLPCRVNPVRFP